MTYKNLPASLGLLPSRSGLNVGLSGNFNGLGVIFLAQQAFMNKDKAQITDEGPEKKQEEPERRGSGRRVGFHQINSLPTNIVHNKKVFCDRRPQKMNADDISRNPKIKKFL